MLDPYLRTGYRRGMATKTLASLPGWAVQIRRKDGSIFLSCNVHGNVTPVWVKKNRKWAAAHAQDLKANGFDARAVPVAYAEPQVVENRKG